MYHDILEGLPCDGLSIREFLAAHAGQSFTYDNVNVLPRFVESPPRDVDLRVELAPGLTTLPIISSPMDTVTEWRMATQMALNGCLGALHINLTIDEVIEQIEKVKRYQMGFIWNPVCLPRTATLQDAQRIRATHGFSTIPITEGEDGKGEFIGLITKACLDLETNPNRRLVELMLPSDRILVATQEEVPTLAEAKQIFRHNPSVSKLPILNDDDGGLAALVNRKNVGESEKYAHPLVDGNNQLRVAVAVTTMETDDERVVAILDAGADAIVVDSSQGGTGYAVRRIKQIRELHGDIPIIGGNVVTPRQAAPLFEAGMSIVKVGMGPGSICITQGQYGIGRGQGVSVAYNSGCIADGGIRSSGDMVKAFALGAKAVMVGKYLAGCDESAGELVEVEGRPYKEYRGMGSISSMRRRSAARYDGDVGNKGKRIIAQGIEDKVPAIGPLDARIDEALLGVRGAIAQLGCSSITELQQAVREGEIRFEYRTEAAKREGDATPQGS